MDLALLKNSIMKRIVNDIIAIAERMVIMPPIMVLLRRLPELIVKYTSELNMSRLVKVDFIDVWGYRVGMVGYVRNGLLYFVIEVDNNNNNVNSVISII